MNLLSLARMNTSTTGTGTTLTLTTAVTGFLTFAQAGAADATTYPYAISDGSNSEEGTLVYTASGTTVVRTVRKSTNGDAAISLSGSAQIFITPAAEDLIPTLSAGVPLGGRLTLTSATPVTEADVTGGTTLYYTPAVSDWLPLYDGVGWVPKQFAELSIALDSNSGHAGYHQSGKNFDTYAALDSSTLRIGTSPAWSSDTARGAGAGTTEIELYQGRFVNKNSITLRFGSASGNTFTVAARKATLLGSIRCTADGQTEDSFLKRLVSNVENTAPRVGKVNEATASWTYSTTAFRQTNGSTANQVALLHCLSGRLVESTAVGEVTNSTTTIRNCSPGIGVDSNSVDGGCIFDNMPATSAEIRSGFAYYLGYPGIGYHTIRWLEFANSNDTQTWVGGVQTGLRATIIN